MSGDPTSGVQAVERPRAGPRARRALLDPDRGLPWLVGAVAGLVVLGPGLAPGGLFNLDLVVPDQLPVPRGAWGLGPELPRRVPLWLPMAWVSPVGGAPALTKVLIVGAVATAVAGAWRLARAAGARSWAAAGAGLAYGLSPFTLTRLGIGHLMVVVTLALLPWAVDDLVHPSRSLRRTFLWGVALSIPNFFGGTVAAIVVVVGLLGDRGRRAPAVLGTLVASQALWLVPALTVAWSGSAGDLSGSASFPSQADGVLGFGYALAGHGFWQPPLQVGWPELYDLPGPVGWVVSLLGLVLAALAVVGTPSLPGGLARRLPWLGGVGLALTVAGTLPLVDAPVAWLTRTWVGGPFREAQRYLLLYLVWVAPAAGAGATVLARRLRTPAASAVGDDGPALAPAIGDEDGPVARGGGRGALADVVLVLPLAVALVLAGPGLWGVGGALAPRQLPAEWSEVRQAVRTEPGPVLALPFLLYLDVPFEDGTARRMLNPVPLYLGGDVVTGSDPLLGGASQERPDPREALLADPLVELRTRSVEGGGDPRVLSSTAGRLGFRWVVVVEGSDASRYRAVADDPGLEPVVVGDTIALYAVRAWPGLVTDAGGEVVPSRPVVEPLAGLDASGPAVVRRPGAAGWLRGTATGAVDDDGLLALPGGSGPLWFWPSLVVLAADLAVLAAVVACIRGGARRPR